MKKKNLNEKKEYNQKHTKKQKKKGFLLFPKLKCTNLKTAYLFTHLICTWMFVIRSPIDHFHTMCVNLIIPPIFEHQFIIFFFSSHLTGILRII